MVTSARRGVEAPALRRENRSHDVQRVMRDPCAVWEESMCKAHSAFGGLLPGVPAYLALFGHPHQIGPHSSLNWGGSLSTPCLDDVVTPAIRAARDLYQRI
jgi:hypothetical protein